MKNNKEILEVSIPIVFGIVIVAIFLIVLIIWCYRKKTNNPPSPRGEDRNARAIEARNRLLVEVEQNRDRGGRQAQDEPITYSDLVRNDIQFNASVPLNIGPPPSYDEIGRNDTSNRSHAAESPPSYETAMSEPTTASPERSIPTASGVHVTSDSGEHSAPGRDSSSRLLNQLQPNVSNEDSSSERREVFV